MSAPQEFDLFGDAIPTYDTKVFTPEWFAQMYRWQEQGRRCRAHHAWLKREDKRWSPLTFEKLGDGYVRSTSWKD